MGWWLDCPRIGVPVELTDERFGHIRERHPDLLPEHFEQLIGALAAPDDFYPGREPNELVFSRWYDSLYGGKYVLVFALRDTAPERYWVVTARVSRVPLRKGAG